MKLALLKPVYLFQPRIAFRQVFRRWRRSALPATAETILPWGLRIAVQPRQAIGLCIYKSRIYDLLTTEVISRLVGPGEACVDCGANIGYTTSLMAVRAGKKGVVHAFEAHPEIFAQLRENTARWDDGAAIHLHCLGASDSAAGAILWQPEEFAVDRGGSTLEAPSRGDASVKGIAIKTGRLDELLGETETFGLMKIDVEGHELAVFRGMPRLFGGRRIRDIIFEEWAPFPAETHRLLAEHGYTIFLLGQRFTGPRLLGSGARRNGKSHDPINYLATLDPARARDLLRAPGWNCLSGSRANPGEA